MSIRLEEFAEPSNASLNAAVAEIPQSSLLAAVCSYQFGESNFSALSAFVQHYDDRRKSARTVENQNTEY